MAKFYHVVGTRPQFIKAVAVTSRFESAGLDYEIVNTGQHFDTNMADDFLKMATKRPKYNLNINSGSHGANTGRMIVELEKIFLTDQPSHVVVYGDCDTTLAASIAAVKIQGMQLVHLESGCRSGLRYQPEEINRKMVDSVADQLFCATSFDVENLLNEGVDRKKITFCGHLHRELTDRVLSSLDDTRTTNDEIGSQPFYLFTLHRKENMQRDTLEHIFKELAQLDKRVVFLVHPVTQKTLDKSQLTVPGNFEIRPPVDYHSMIRLILDSDGVITDSGGIRFEALYLQRPCYVLRRKNESEWHQLDDMGYLKYFDPDTFKSLEITNFGPRPSNINLDGVMTDALPPSEIIVRRLNIN